MRMITLMLLLSVAACKKEAPLCETLNRATVNTANQTSNNITIYCDNTIYCVVEPFSAKTLDYYPSGTHVFRAVAENQTTEFWTVTVNLARCSNTTLTIN